MAGYFPMEDEQNTGQILCTLCGTDHVFKLYFILWYFKFKLIVIHLVQR